MVLVTTELTPHSIAGCCHLANLMPLPVFSVSFTTDDGLFSCNVVNKQTIL